jgi:hypothetical protein
MLNSKDLELVIKNNENILEQTNSGIESITYQSAYYGNRLHELLNERDAVVKTINGLKILLEKTKKEEEKDELE